MRTLLVVVLIVGALSQAAPGKPPVEEPFKVEVLPVVKVAPKISRVAPSKANPSNPGPKPSSKDAKPLGKKTAPATATKSNAAKSAPAKKTQAKKTQPVPRFKSLVVRSRMEVSGWVDAFFQKFVELANKITAMVKGRVTALIQGLEAQIQGYIDMAQTMWTYFKNQGLAEGIRTLWLNTRCDLCQSAMVRIYLRGCEYAKMGICTIVSQVACGGLADNCKKFICPMLNKFFLDAQCNNIMSKLNSAIATNPLDNFATLAVCKRVGLCKEFDEPFDGAMMTAIVTQAKKINEATALAKTEADKTKAVESVIAQPSQVVPPFQRYSQPGTYALPGLGCVIHIWINIQYKSPEYGQPYYILDKLSGPTAGIKDLLWLDKVDGKSVKDLGPAGVLEALTAPAPGTKMRLDFIENGFFGLKPRAYTVTFAAWPATLYEVTKS